MKPNDIVLTLTRQEFEDLLYKYTRIANDQLYKGLLNHINDILDRVDNVEEIVEYLKVSQQSKPRGRKKKVVDEE